MKIKFLGQTSFLVLTNNKEYDVISKEKGWYRIIDDSGDDYLYPPHLFTIVEEDEIDSLKREIYGISPPIGKKSAVSIAIAGK